MLGCASASPGPDAELSEPVRSTGQQGNALTVAPSNSGAAVGAVPPAQLQRLRHALSRSPQNLRITDSSKYQYVELNGTFQTATVIVNDGVHPRQRVCLDNAAELDRIVGSK
jgi:hypothetical protein